MLGDITNPKWLYAKGGLFLFTGLFAATLLVIENPTWYAVFLLGVAIWSFCRLYYFLFYVIQHYADPDYKFAGLLDFVRYLLRKRKIPPT